MKGSAVDSGAARHTFGQPLVAPKKLNKLGELQVPKASVPQRAALAIQTAFKRLLGRPMTVGLPPMPRTAQVKPEVPENHDPGISAPVLQPKTRTDAAQLPVARLQDVPLTPLQQTAVDRALDDLAGFIQTGDLALADKRLGELVQLLHDGLSNVTTSGALKLAFTLSDGKAFTEDLQQAILSHTSPEGQTLIRLQFEHFMAPYFRDAFDTLASGLADRAIASDAQGPTKIEVQGRTYHRDGNAPLARGNFGAVWTFTNPHDPEDRVVLKLPLVGANPTPEKKRETQLDGPLREGQAAVQVMGSGGGASRNATLLGALRTGDSAQLVFRYEPRGGLDKALVKLESSTDTDVVRGRLGLMQDLLAAVQRMHEAKGVVHRDIAARNVLIDGSGRAVLSDLGLAQFLPESASNDGGTVVSGKPQATPLPVRWTAPEVLRGEPASPKSDVFSLGITFLEMAYGLASTGMVPFYDKTNIEVFTLLTEGWKPDKVLGAIPPGLWPGVDSVALRSMIVRMLDADPSKRPTLGELAASPLFEAVGPQQRKALLAALQAPAPVVVANDVVDEQPPNYF